MHDPFKLGQSQSQTLGPSVAHHLSKCVNLPLLRFYCTVDNRSGFQPRSSQVGLGASHSLEKRHPKHMPDVHQIDNNDVYTRF